MQSWRKVTCSLEVDEMRLPQTRHMMPRRAGGHVMYALFKRTVGAKLSSHGVFGSFWKFRVNQEAYFTHEDATYISLLVKYLVDAMNTDTTQRQRALL
jgi:hypothetical protein